MWPLIFAAASAAGSVYGGIAQRRQYEHAASAARWNAAFAKLWGMRQAGRARRAGERRIGEQRAAYARSGVVVDDGTPLVVAASTAADAEEVAQEILIDYQNQYSQYKAEASRLMAAGEAAQFQGFMHGMSTILAAYGKYKEIRPGPIEEPMGLG